MINVRVFYTLLLKANYKILIMIKIKIKPFTFLCVAIVLIISSCQNSTNKSTATKNTKKVANQLKPVSITGNNFTINNEKIQFKGLCLEDLGELISIGYWNEEYIKQASLWNINIVRFPVHPSHYNRLGKEKYLAELKKGIEWAKKYNMYSIIDWHVIGNLKDEKWQHEMYKTTMEETLDFWKTIAQQYANEPAVAFYELYNEPTVFSGKLGEMNWKELMNIYSTLLDTVRKYDELKIALLGGFNWSYDLTAIKEYDPEFKNVGFVAHPYPQKSEQPWTENWDKHFGFIADKYPIFATEFGFAYEEQEGSHIPVIGDEKYGEEILAYFNQKNISYTAWVFSWHWYPMLLKDSTFTPNKGQGEFFYKKFTE